MKIAEATQEKPSKEFKRKNMLVKNMPNETGKGRKFAIKKLKTTEAK